MGRREAFDPLQSYVANRTFAFGAKTYRDGDAFNERDDMRRMRQLYDSRYLRMAEKRTDEPDFKSMTEGELKDWLIAKGFATLAHPRSPHVRLVERARRVWAEMAQAQLANPSPKPNLPTATPAAPAPPLPNGEDDPPIVRERLSKPAERGKAVTFAAIAKGRTQKAPSRGTTVERVRL